MTARRHPPVRCVLSAFILFNGLLVPSRPVAAQPLDLPNDVHGQSFDTHNHWVLGPAGTIVSEPAFVPDGGLADVANWLGELEIIRQSLDAKDLPDLSAAESALMNSIQNTRSHFRRTASASNYEAWMRYLRLEPLVDAIEEEKSIAIKGRAALALMPQLRGVEQGLERSAVVALRESLDRYIAALRYSDPKRGLALVRRQLDGLVDLLSHESEALNDETASSSSGRDPNATSASGADEPPTRSIRSWRDLSSEDRDQLELFLNGLADAGQATRLAAMIQSRFTQPNVHAWVNGKTITDSVTRPVNNPTEVNDCILGTRLKGQAQLNGVVTAQLLPQDGYVRMLLRLDGDFSTTTRGFRKPITLDSTGTAKVYSARQLAITEKRMVLGETVTTADLSTQIQRINHPLKIVRKIAMRKANESNPLAERISERKLRERVQSEFDQETSRAAGRTFPDIDTLLRPWLGRLDFPDIDRRIGSTSTEVYATAKMQRPLGLAAAAPPPSAAMTRNASGSIPLDYLATIQIHESLLGNTLAGWVAGQTFTPDRIERIAQVLELSLPTKARANSNEPTGNLTGDPAGKVSQDDEDTDAEPFEIDFANFRPLYFEAEQQRLRIGLRANRLSRGDRELKTAVEVSATYRPVIGPDATMWLVRDEDIDFSFSSSRRLSIGQTAIKANIEEGFDNLFPRELLHREFTVPPSVTAPALSGRRLRISSIDLTDHWISITVR